MAHIIWCFCNLSTQIKCHRMNLGSMDAKTYLYACGELWSYRTLKANFHTNGSFHLFNSHAQIQKVLSEGIQRWGEGGSKYNYKRAIMARQRNAIKWRFPGVPMMAQHWMLVWYSSTIFQGIRTCIARKPYIFVIFQGGGGPDPLSPLGFAHDSSILRVKC